MKKTQLLRAALFCLWLNPLLSQTQVDLGTQSKNVDFSTALSTIPQKTGTTLPATCALGEAFFKTDEPAGHNVYGCTNTDVWTLQTGGVDSVFGRTGTVAAAPGDYSSSQVDNTPAGGIAATDVQSAINELDAEKAAGAHTHPPGDVDDGGVAATHALFSGAGGAAAFRAVADADLPAGIARDSEINVQGTANEISSSGPGVAPTLSIPPNFDISGKTTTKPIKSGTTLPGTCAVGEFFFDTDATAGQNTYACTSVNTWTLQGGGEGAKPPRELSIMGGVNQGGIASTGWSLGTTGAPTPVVVSSPLSAVLSFGVSGDECAQTQLKIPDDWDASTATAEAVWRANTIDTDEDVAWTHEQECVGNDEDFVAWVSTAAIVDAALGTANRHNQASFASLTMTGCNAGDTMFARVCRDEDNVADDLTVAAELIRFTWKFGRN